MVDGSTKTMAFRASIAALLMLGGSISAAAEAPVPVTAAPEDTSGLPRFEPSQAEFAEAFDAFDHSAVVQALPEAQAEAEASSHALSGGVASWYGPGFAGHRTASGERFNPAEYTAAHRTLPFGSKVRVSYGGRSVVVRINDRGPFSGHRVIDLSQAAAEDLGLRRAGSGRVELALLES
jgi:rare lipoprotein A